VLFPSCRRPVRIQVIVRLALPLRWSAGLVPAWPAVNPGAGVIVLTGEHTARAPEPSCTIRRRPRREATTAYSYQAAGCRSHHRGGGAVDSARAAGAGRQLCRCRPVHGGGPGPARPGLRRRDPGGTSGRGLRHRSRPQPGRPPVVASGGRRHVHRDRGGVCPVQHDGDQDLAGDRLLRGAPAGPGRCGQDVQPRPGLVLLGLRGAPGVLRPVAGMHHRGRFLRGVLRRRRPLVVTLHAAGRLRATGYLHMVVADAGPGHGRWARSRTPGPVTDSGPGHGLRARSRTPGPVTDAGGPRRWPRSR
jgi:hypothetical protein